MSNYIYEMLHVNIVCHNAEKFYGDDDPVFTGSVYLDDMKTLYTGYVGEITYMRNNAGNENIGTYYDAIGATVEDANPALTYSVINGTFKILPWTTEV